MYVMSRAGSNEPLWKSLFRCFDYIVSYDDEIHTEYWRDGGGMLEVRKLVYGIPAATGASFRAPGLASPSRASTRGAARPRRAMLGAPRPYRPRLQFPLRGQTKTGPMGPLSFVGGGGGN